MKTTVMAALLLGISFVNVAPLQSRAEGNSSAADEQGHAPRAMSTAADKPAATKPEAKTQRRQVTVQVPVKRTIMVPVTTTDFVPQQVFVDTTIDAPPPIPRPVAEPAGVVAAAPAPAQAVAAGPSAAGASGKDSQSVPAPAAASSDIPPAFSFFVDSKGNNYTPSEARVNLPYILQHMDRFQRDQKELRASLAEKEKWQQTELETIAAVKQRLEQEKDPLIRTYLKKGVAQSDLEVQRKSQEWTDKLIRHEKEMYQQNMQRIMDEIARCAKGYKFHIVRRMPYPREKRPGAFLPPPPVSSIGTSDTWGISPGSALFLAAPAPVDALPQSSLGSTPVFGIPTVARPDASASYPPEILYVAEVQVDQSPDISDEIVKRLNAADEAKGKASSATRK